jgi:hypothetical protein
LGILPLLWVEEALYGADVAGRYIESGIASWMDRYIPVPKSPPAPAAPQTKEEMSVAGAWTQEKLAQADRDNWNKWRVNPFPELPFTNENNLWIWIALGAGAVGIILLARK